MRVRKDIFLVLVRYGGLSWLDGVFVLLVVLFAEVVVVCCAWPPDPGASVDGPAPVSGSLSWSSRVCLVGGSLQES